MLKLHIGNKNYSSWSMRPWVLMTRAGIPFEEVVLRFDSFDPDSQFKRSAEALSPSGTVPVLVDGALVVWDSLAIAEYRRAFSGTGAVAAGSQRTCAGPQRHRRDAQRIRRAALALSHEHRSAASRGRGAGTVRTAGRGGRPAAPAGALGAVAGPPRGPLLFDRFSIADAFFAPVVMRLHTYAVPVSPRVAAYMQQVRALPGVQAWIAAALDEHDFRPFEEPYRQAPDRG